MRLIDADALKYSRQYRIGKPVYYLSKNDIDLAKTIDPATLRPHGEWIKRCITSVDSPDVSKCSIYCPNCGADMRDEAISKSVTFNRIVELMDAEAEGRLVVLPCKVGDTVFCILAMGKEIIEDIVEDADIWSIKDGIKVRLTLKTFKDYVVGEFGKTVFLTKEEAERALKTNE